MSATHDIRIEELLEVLKGKIITLEDNTPKPHYETNCLLRSSATSTGFINLQVIQSVGRLVEILGDLLTIRDKRIKAAEMLEFQLDLDYHGFTFDEWISDIKLRAKILNHQDDLMELRSKYEYFQGKVSETHSLGKELDALEKFLK